MALGRLGLGGLACPGLYQGEAVQEIQAIAIRQQKELQNGFTENVNWRMMEMCYHASIIYKIKYLTINEKEI